MRKTKILLSVDAELKEVIIKYCQKNDISVSWLFSKLFQQHLEGDLAITIKK